ncbi:MAG: signal recognition particle protein [Vicinamibacteria bacterium]|nr:signal recognition particle protein [Vicinamibacteria bacterium]
MFQTLSERLQGVFRALRGRGTLKAQDIEQALREIRLALLEADVHFQVVKQLLERVRHRASGQEILRSLTPDQAVLRVVRDEMIEILGGETTPRLSSSVRFPSVVLLVGLQGSGKTTTAAKLALWLNHGGHAPLLVSTDVRRPAAREQLKKLGEQGQLKVHHPEEGRSAQELLRSALTEARSVGHDYLLVDTAGRLHVDEDLMTELCELKEIGSPSETLFVGDAMTGQDAVRSAAEFHARVGLTGIILTKLDGDARGGAALSMAAVSGCPVKFAGTGERLADLAPFHPARMVSRVLGMGDVLTLIERAEETVERGRAEESVRRFRKGDFTLQDYREQLIHLRKLGPLDRVLSLIPGAGALSVDSEAGEREMRRALAILDSMTFEERRLPSIMNGSRRKRIARGSGTAVEDVNRLIKQFTQARKMMKGLSGGGKALQRMARHLHSYR